jgi:hypothetical protein
MDDDSEHFEGLAVRPERRHQAKERRARTVGLTSEVVAQPGAHFWVLCAAQLVGRSHRVELGHDHPQRTRANFTQQTRLLRARPR